MPKEDPSGTPPLTRHLLLRTRLGHLEWSVTEFVFACLDALGIREGAAHTEVRIVNGEPALIEMNPRLMGPVMEPDPNFIALGYTQQHVLVDRFLRPAEFKRQLDIPYQPRRALARCQLRAVRSGRVTGLPGLSRLRQLPGFHSVLRLPGYGQILDRTRLNNGTTGVAYLVHESADVLRESLRAIHEMEDVDDLFALAPL
jgi:hypothetical protein